MKAAIISLLMLAMGTTAAMGAVHKNTLPQADADSVAAAQRAQEIRDSLMVIVDRAGAGDTEAMNEIGKWYFTGTHYDIDYDKAYEWWKKAAMKSDVSAIANLGICYQYGLGVEKDSISAVNLYEKSIKEGNEALLAHKSENADISVFDAVLVGECYEKGVGVTRDVALAADFYAKAADRGSIDGIRKAAICYLNAKDNDRAFKYFELGAGTGDIACEFWVGKMLMTGKVESPDTHQAVVYLLRAAEGGLPAAQNEVGVLYADGNGVTKNDAQAAEWYRKAALGGNARGMWNYAVALKDGVGVAQDYDMALFWFAEAASLGYQRSFNRMIDALDAIGDPFAHYVLGMKLYLVDGDLNAANDRFKKVAKAKVDEGGIMQAVILADPDNPKPNAGKAAKTLEKMSATNPKAALSLASIYERGIGLPQDMEKVISLCRTAADMGYGKAQSYMGDIYYEGRGTDKDLDKAVDMYLKALGNRSLSPAGCVRLAECYESGLAGLPVDKKMAEQLRQQKNEESIGLALQRLK